MNRFKGPSIGKYEAGGRAAGKGKAESKASVTEERRSRRYKNSHIRSLTRAMLGSKTANQCPGELFMPALSLIHLYYRDCRLQS